MQNGKSLFSWFFSTKHNNNNSNDDNNVIPAASGRRLTKDFASRKKTFRKNSRKRVRRRRIKLFFHYGSRFVSQIPSRTCEREMPTVVRAAKCRWLEDGDKKVFVGTDFVRACATYLFLASTV